MNPELKARMAAAAEAVVMAKHHLRQLPYTSLMDWLVAHQRDLLAALGSSRLTSEQRAALVAQSYNILAKRFTAVGIVLENDQ